MSNPQINPPASTSGESGPSNLPDPGAPEEGSSSELQGPGTPPANPQGQTSASFSGATPRSFRWEVDNTRRLMSPYSFEMHSLSPYYTQHLPLGQSPSQSSITVSDTGTGVAIAPHLQDSSTQTIPTPPANPWYRIFTDLFHDLPGKPHTTAFVLGSDT
ncbi:hypothetical protein B9Z19DRAFT_1067265 [Tuber borchii]|uniref:Uncharacterized protein n=1 Tax=Tuber borchii TaxID=42251 RepID=A0A2T6ZJK4_TUBBO|nr:hypothetical protein B9Z19DRAFT_1067265 [Tuber borchii]